jgi:hypothetical protein
MSTTKKKDLNSLGNIYGDILNNVKRNIVKESKVKEGEIGESPLLDGGPQEKGGFVPAKLDRKKMSKKELDDNLYKMKDLSYDDDSQDNEEDEEIPLESRKIARESLNNFMSKKSIFDRLYENVIGQTEGPQGPEDTSMEELDALGIEGDTEGESDEITITLDRETAQKLHDVLMPLLSGEDETEGEGEYEGGEEDYEMGGPEEDEEDFGHAVNAPKEPNMGKNNKVGNLRPQSGGASSKYTDKVGDDGDHGHALVNAKEPNYGKNNKVGSLKTGKSMFEQ